MAWVTIPARGQILEEGARRQEVGGFDPGHFDRLRPFVAGERVHHRHDHGVDLGLVVLPFEDAVLAHGQAGGHRGHVGGGGGGELRADLGGAALPRQPLQGRMVGETLEEAPAKGIDEEEDDLIDLLRQFAVEGAAQG